MAGDVPSQGHRERPLTAVKGLAFEDRPQSHHGGLRIWHLDAHVRLAGNRRLDAQSLRGKRQCQVPLQVGDLRHSHLHLLRILSLNRASSLDETGLDCKLSDGGSDPVADHGRGNAELRQGLHDHAGRLIDGPLIGAGSLLCQQDVQRRKAGLPRQRFSRAI